MPVFLKRECPNCGEKSVRAEDLLLRHTYCPECRSCVGVRRGFALLVNLVSFLVTVLTSLIVLIQMGNFWALVWFSVPIASFAYLKARLGPLEVKQTEMSP